MSRFTLPPAPPLAGLLTAAAAVLTLAPAGVSTASAQSAVTGGFDETLPAVASGRETSTQADLWVMQVDFKPMRLVRLPIEDPQTGEVRRELVWYLVWRATNRPLKSPERDTSAVPQNVLDDPPGERPFVPELVLIGEDGSAKQYRDVVLPAVLPLIARRELRGPFKDVELKTSVEAAGDLPARVDRDAAPGQGAVYGVATWTGIDPTTDKFTVLLNGFSNGYRLEEGPDGKEVVARRTGIVKFWRPGDEIDEREQEFRVGVDPRGEEPLTAGVPQWEYLPDEAADSDGVGDIGAEAGDDGDADPLPEEPAAEAVDGFGEN